MSNEQIVVPRADLLGLADTLANIIDRAGSVALDNRSDLIRHLPIDPPTPGSRGDEPSSEEPFVDAGAFYDFLRGNKMLGPKISQDEFNGCEIIVRACRKAGWGVSWVAYALATAYHETAHSMLPIKEIGGDAYYTRMYDIRGARPAKAKELGNTTPGDGARYPGRGYPQTTGKDNYAKATRKLRERGFDVDLVADPDRMMEPAIAAATMVSGMEEGWFTGRKLADDLPRRGPASLRQFFLSRDIINGTDKDDEIAAYSIDWQSALQAGRYLEPA